MIGEEKLTLHDPCSEESLGHFPGGIPSVPFSGWSPDLPDLMLSLNADLFPYSPEIQQPSQAVETHENPDTVLHVTDRGNNSNKPKCWRLNQYNRIELTLDGNSLPIIVDKVNWCKGNSKKNLPVLKEPYLILSVSAYGDEQAQELTPCGQPGCPSKKSAGTVQITSTCQLLEMSLDLNNRRTITINVRLMCLHHTSIKSYILRFEIRDNRYNLLGSDKLDIGKPKANRSTKRAKNDPGFHNPPLGFVLVFIKATHFTFRTNWRASSMRKH
jgi:hypothetical protein